MAAAPILDIDTLSAAVSGAVALRACTRLQPAAGPGTKVFPPTYVSDDNRQHGHTRYATETRRIDGRDELCVLLDSVASQANRMELALLDWWRSGLDFPLVRVDFTPVDDQLEAPVGAVTTLEAPHRIYDAILRDSVDEAGTLFRYTAAGQDITHATPRDATALYAFCPTALIFGAWDSTGPKGGLGSKFQRALTSEIVAIGVRTGTKVGGRLDPLGIVKKAGPVYEADGVDAWTMEKKGKAKKLNPSDINHGNVAPSRDDEAGGVTFDYALQTTVVSLPAIRRLRFPRTVDDTQQAASVEAQGAARVALCALAVAGITAAYAEGHDLRSGALLVGEGPLQFDVVGSAGEVTGTYLATPESARALLMAAAGQAADHGMRWQREPLPPLRPAEKLVQLLRKSQALEAREPPQAGADD